MTLFRLTDHAFEPVDRATFAGEAIRERHDLQPLLRDSIDLLVPGGFVLAEEYTDWIDSKRRIDLLCLDRDATLVVVELKRGETGGFMDLQAIRYAAMVSQMTFERAVNAHESFLSARGSEEDAEERILEYLGWEAPDEERFARDVRIVLAASDFSTELTTVVLWLNKTGLDIRCVRLAPYKLDSQTLVHIERVIPVPEAEEYQVRMREKSIEKREARQEQKEFSGYWFVNIGESDGEENHRSWEDCRKYGFVSAGGESIHRLGNLSVGDRFFAYRTGRGYVGVGVVTQALTPWEVFVSETAGKPLTELPLEQPQEVNVDRPLRAHCIAVRWLKTVDREDAIRAEARRGTACKIYGHELPEELLDKFDLHEPAWA